MRFGLSEQIISGIINVCSAFDEVDEVILFGSRAKGNYKTGSDIDLAITGGKVSLSVLNRISLMLDELNSPYTFDLIILHHIDNLELTDHIKRVGVTLLKKR